MDREMKIKLGKKYLVVMNRLKTEMFAVQQNKHWKDIYKMQSAFGEHWVRVSDIKEIEEECKFGRGERRT